MSVSPETAARFPSYAYVGFGDRLLAFVFDTLIFFIVSIPILIAIYGRDYLARSDEGFAGFWDFAIQAVVPAAAVILFWRRYGATPGKLAIYARIVDARTGEAPATGRLVARYFGYFISSLPLFLGFAWIAIDRRKQGWHDKIAGTLVVYDDD
ncbi:MAG: RDD family protein [Betaproteobacteria bacterium]